MSLNKLSGVYVELTNKCNKFCPYCYNDSGDKCTYLDMNSILKIIDECKLNHIDQITLSGGEPYLHPNIHYIIQYANKKNILIKVITNLSLITINETIEFLKNGNFIQLTLDSPHEEKNDKTRGVGSYAKIIQLLKRTKKMKINENIYIRMNLYKDNVQDIQDFINLCLNYKIKHVAITFLAKSGRGSSFSLAYNFNQSMNEVVNIVNFLKQKKEEYDKVVDISYSNLEDQRGCVIFRRNNLKVVPRIDPDGNVYFCSYFFGNENILGNIKSSTLSEIINSDKMSSFINKVITRVKNDDCTSCSFNKICLCGCPAVSYMNTNNIYNKEDQCKLIKNFIKNSLKESF